MGISTKKARKDLSADALFKRLHAGFDKIPDSRSGDLLISMGDALMSAFAMFSLKDPSLLAFDKRRHDPNDNFHTIYGIQHVPCDSQMRALLDPVDPAHLRPMFRDVFRCLQRGKVLEDFVYLDGHYLISLDGTGYFSSSTIKCPSCLEKHHRNGTVTYSHQLLGAVLVHPDHKEVIPLAPEPIIKADGDAKNPGAPGRTQRHPPLAQAVSERTSAPAHHRDRGRPRRQRSPSTRSARSQRPFHHRRQIRRPRLLVPTPPRRRRGGPDSDPDRDRCRYGHPASFPFPPRHAAQRIEPRLLGQRPRILGNPSHTDRQESRTRWPSAILQLDYRLVADGGHRYRRHAWRSGALEGRERDFQHAEKSGLQPGTQLRPRRQKLVGGAGLADDARFPRRPNTVPARRDPLFQAAWKKLGTKCNLWEQIRNLFQICLFGSMTALLEALVRGIKRQPPVLSDST